MPNLYFCQRFGKPCYLPGMFHFSSCALPMVPFAYDCCCTWYSMPAEPQWFNFLSCIFTPRLYDSERRGDNICKIFGISALA